MSSALAVELSNPVIEMLIINDMVMYEMLANYKSGKPLLQYVNLHQKALALQNNTNLKTIYNSIENISFFKQSKMDKYTRIKEVIDILRKRVTQSKEFFSKYEIMNPYKLLIAYGCFRQEKGQQIVIRELPMEFGLDFYFDLHSNNERSYLFSSAIRRTLSVDPAKGLLDSYSQFVSLHLIISWHSSSILKSIRLCT